MNIDQLATNAILGENGMWKTPTAKNVSYTINGHELIKEKEKNSFWFSHRLECLKKVIPSSSIETTIDIGGGNGEFSKYLQSIGIETLLLEPGVRGAINANENGIENIINGSLMDAGFIDSAFHSAVLLDVLEHIECDEKFLAEIFRILKPGGKLILTVPAFQFLFSSFDKEVGHYRRYTLNNLSKKLSDTGFTMDYKTYFFSFLPLPIVIGRLLINRFKSKRNRKSTGHINKYSVLGRLFRFLLFPEKLIIKRKIKIPFGSSCLVVVHKPETYEK